MIPENDFIDASTFGGICEPAEICAACGEILTVGQSPYCRDGHARVGGYVPFTPYFDFALGVQVTSLAERWRHMRGTIDPESGRRVGQLDYRDKMSKGDLSARLDRVAQQKREQARG